MFVLRRPSFHRVTTLNPCRSTHGGGGGGGAGQDAPSSSPPPPRPTLQSTLKRYGVAAVVLHSTVYCTTLATVFAALRVFPEQERAVTEWVKDKTGTALPPHLAHASPFFLS